MRARVRGCVVLEPKYSCLGASFVRFAWVPLSLLRSCTCTAPLHPPLRSRAFALIVRLSCRWKRFSYSPVRHNSMHLTCIDTSSREYAHVHPCVCLFGDSHLEALQPPPLPLPTFRPPPTRSSNTKHNTPQLQWDAVFRGGMVLETPELSYVGPEDSKRQFCVATVRRDAKTGTVRVTAAGVTPLQTHSCTTYLLPPLGPIGVIFISKLAHHPCPASLGVGIVFSRANRAVGPHYPRPGCVLTDHVDLFITPHTTPITNRR